MVEIIVSAITAIVAIIVAVITGRNNERLKRIEIDSAATREQTQNEHATAEFPNMRDELTATRMAVGASAESQELALNALAESLERQMATLEGYIRDVDKTVRATQHSAERQASLVDLRFSEMPGLIETSIRAHSLACPLKPTQLNTK